MSTMKYDNRVWFSIYDYEYNNHAHWGYTERDSRVFKSKLADAVEIGDRFFGTFDEETKQ